MWCVRLIGQTIRAGPSTPRIHPGGRISGSHPKRMTNSTSQVGGLSHTAFLLVNGFPHLAHLRAVKWHRPDLAPLARQSKLAHRNHVQARLLTFLIEFCTLARTTKEGSHSSRGAEGTARRCPSNPLIVDCHDGQVLSPTARSWEMRFASPAVACYPGSGPPISPRDGFFVAQRTMREAQWRSR
jgi:hypothetical protein